MNLSPEQKQAVASWVATGDNLSAIQKKLSEQFKISLTYRDVRFLVDDLDLALKDAAPKVDTSDVTKARPAAQPENAPHPGAAGIPDDPADEAAPGEEDFPADAPLGEDADATPSDGASGVTVSVDKVTLIPGALASGSVTFSDGVTGKWVVDQYGRPGFTKISQDGYRPSPADAQSFMQELSAALQKQGY